MHNENKLHAPQGGVVFNLSTTGFKLMSKTPILQEGKHKLALYSLNPFSKPYTEGEPAPEDVLYKGEMEVILVDTDGHVHTKVIVGNRGIPHYKKNNTSWSDLAELEIKKSHIGEWNMMVNVVVGDLEFREIHSEVRLIPPQKFDIGWYTFGKFIQIALSVVLFILGVFGFYFSKNKLQKENPS